MDVASVVKDFRRAVLGKNVWKLLNLKIVGRFLLIPKTQLLFWKALSTDSFKLIVSEEYFMVLKLCDTLILSITQTFPKALYSD